MTNKRLSGEDKVAVLVVLFGLGGGALLYRLAMPSIMTSLFLSAGISSLVYRFLGGIKGAEFSMGPMKLGGTIAALIGVAWWLDSTRGLDPQYKFHLISAEAIVGSWDWKSVDADTGLDGTLDFVKSNGKLTFTGMEYRLEHGPQGGINNVPFFQMTNGVASLSPDGTSLSMESDVKEFQYGRTFHWKTEEPLVLVPAFGGLLWPKRPRDYNLESRPWGILITRNSSR